MGTSSKSNGHGHKAMGMRHDDSRLGSTHSSSEHCYKDGGPVTHPGHKFAEERKLRKRGNSPGSKLKW